jgi:hypothetical protein
MLSPLASLSARSRPLGEIHRACRCLAIACPAVRAVGSCAVTAWPHPCIVHPLPCADFKIDCDSALYLRLYYYSIFMFLLYPIGIPFFFSVLLYKNVDAIYAHNKGKVRRRCAPTAQHSCVLGCERGCARNDSMCVRVVACAKCVQSGISEGVPLHSCPIPRQAMSVRHDYDATDDAEAGVDPPFPRQSVLEVDGANLTPVDHKRLRQVWGGRWTRVRPACTRALAVPCLVVLVGQAPSPRMRQLQQCRALRYP